PFQRETLPIQNTRTRLNEPSARIVGFRTEDAAALGGLRDLAGNEVVLQGTEMAVNEDLAEEIEAEVGDTMVVFNRGEPVEFVVKAIVRTDVLSGAIDPSASHGAAVSFETITSITGRGQNADAVIVSNTGGAKDGIDRSDAAMDKLERTLDG